MNEPQLWASLCFTLIWINAKIKDPYEARYLKRKAIKIYHEECDLLEYLYNG